MQGTTSRRLGLSLLGAALLWSIAGCPTPPEAIPGTQVMMDFSRKSSFYSAPFPNEDLRGADGRPDISGFPNPKNVSFMKKLLAMAKQDTQGFARTGGVYFQLDGPLDPQRLPTIAQSIKPEATAFLIGVTPDSPDHGIRIPVTYRYEADGGPMGAKHLFSMLPLQGRPLRPNTVYAAVITRALHDATDKPLGVSLAMSQIIAGVQPTGLSDAAWNAYQGATKALKEAGIKLQEIAGLAVFRTEDSTKIMREVVEYQRKQPLPTIEEPWKRTDLFDDFCVYESRLTMPVYQQGKPPFTSEGGDWAFGPDGAPIKQADEPSRIVITLPRKPQPTAGWPMVLFVRTGGGGDRPLVDRGVRATPGGPAVTPGTGPALVFAKAGWAGVSVDGPHGGLRNITKSDEQFLIFNILNPPAMRDNIRQSALELTIVARLLKELRFSVDDCPGLADKSAQEIKFHPEQLVLMGHSMGATIGPLALALEPRFQGAILSGAGGSWIENIMHKRSPLNVRPLAEEVLRYAEIKRGLHAHDPGLTMLQWMGEAADPPAYAHLIIREPLADHKARHILMLQGIVDTYIMPPIANALSLALGLDLAGQALDATHEKLKEFSPLASLLGFVGRKAITLPATANLNGTTGLVIQHLQGPIEDGHEVVFQTTPPQHQYRCFLESLAKGTPKVPQPGKQMTDPCE